MVIFQKSGQNRVIVTKIYVWVKTILISKIITRQTRKEKLVDIYGSVEQNYKNILFYSFFYLRH
jgi:hypothetical protein